jgi:hypothetical protein
MLHPRIEQELWRTTMQQIRKRPWKWRAVAGAQLMLLVACGGSKSAKTSPTTASSTPGLAVTTTAVVATRTVNADAWYGGFQVHVDTATHDPSARSLVLNVAATNNGRDATLPTLHSAVKSKGESFSEESSAFTSPIPAEGKQSGKLQYTVSPTFSLDDAVLTMGTPDEQQVSLPLGTSGAKVTFEPRAVSGLGTISAGALDFAIKSATMRGDDLGQHRQDPKGKWTLEIKFTATYKGTARGGYLLNPNDLTTKAPNGNSFVAETSDVQSAAFALMASVPSNGVWHFTVDDPPAGAYPLTLTSSEDPKPTGSLTLTVA